MKRLRFPSLIALLSLMSGLTARADTLDEWFKLLPKNTIGLMAVKNAPELLADWDKSSFGKLMEDEEFKKWTAPMMKDGEAPWDKEFKEKTGEGLYDNLKRLNGAVLMVVAADSPAEMQGGSSPAVLLIEAGDQQASLDELVKKETALSIEKDDTQKSITKDIAGVEVQILAESDAEDAPWKKAHAFVNGVMILAEQQDVMEHFIMALKNGNAEPSETVNGHLDRLAQLTEGTTDVLVYLNGEILAQWALDAARTAAKDNAQAQAMPISPEQIIGALGLDEMKSIALAVDIADEQSRMEVALLHSEKPVGLITLMRGTGREVALPPFIPADVLSGSVMSYSMVDLWDKLLVIITRMGPMAAMATMQISGVEAQIGVKIRDDLFGSLDDEYVEVTDGSLDKQSQVFAFKVKDHQRLGGALDGVKRYVGGGFAAFEEAEFLGHQISVVKPMNAQPDASEIAFCLTGDYLLFSTGPQALLKKILSRMKDPSGPSIWENDRTQDLLARLPQGYSSVGVADGGKMMKMVMDAMTMAEGQAAKNAKKSKAKKGKGPKAETEDEEAETTGDSLWFDPAAVPSDAMWKRYFGTSVSGYYTPADAIHHRSVTTPVEAQ